MIKQAVLGMALAFTLQGAAADALPRIDACALLTPAQIEAEIGHAVDAGDRRDAGLQPDGSWSSSCVWILKDDSAAPADAAAPLRNRSFVILNAVQWPLGSGRAHEFLDAFHAAAASGVLPRAPQPRRIGDDALWWGDGLAVRTQDVSFGLSVLLRRARPPAPGAFEERLAPFVLRQLDRRHARLSRNTD